MADEEDAFGVGHAQFAADDVALQDVAVAKEFGADAPGFAVAAQAAASGGARSPCLQRAQAFLRAFLEHAPDGHRFANAFHLRGEREWWRCASTGSLEFLEGKASATPVGGAASLSNKPLVIWRKLVWDSRPKAVLLSFPDYSGY